jgi:SNF2 family DNA or RNA helicase
MTRRDYTPRPWQVPMTAHLLNVERGALFCPMGAGKTTSTYTALDALFLAGEDHPVLVLAPLRVARDTWPEEARKWNHLRHVSVMPIVGSEAERRAALKYDASVYTTNYENLTWLVNYWGERWPYRTVVADELSKLKSFRLRQGGKRAAALGRVAHTKVKRFVGLTGTPASNGLQDLWGQVWMLDGGVRLGRTFDAFRQRWFQKSFDGFGMKPLPHAQAEIQEKLRDICLTVDLADYIEIDKPVVNTIYVDLPPQAARLYRDMEKEMFMQLEGHDVEAFNAAARTIKCLQIANGAAYVDDAGNWKTVHDEKLDALDDVVEEAAGAPVLVAYHFKSDLARLQKAYPDGLNIATQDGLARAKKGEGRVWFGHPASIGHGVDGLQEHCNTLAYFGHWWNLEERAQILERIGPTRQMQAGKKRPVFVHNIIARGTVDEMVIERVESKREVQDILLEAMKRKGTQ